MDSLDRLERDAERDESLMSTGEYHRRRDAIYAAEIKAAREYAATPAGQMERAERTVDALRAARTEDGITAEQQAELADAEAQIAELHQAEQDRFVAEWTREITAERRAAWNAWVAGQGSRISAQAVYAQQGRQGWLLATLKRAIDLWAGRGEMPAARR